MYNSSILRLAAVLLVTALLSMFAMQDGLAHPGNHDTPCQGPHASDPECPGDSGGEMPVGTMIMWVTDTAPDGWLLCDGRAVSRTDFAALFDVIRVTYGDGDFNDTFNLPDMRGRFPLGQDDMGGNPANRVADVEASTLGGASGDEEKDTRFNRMAGGTTLTAAQSGSAAHTHNVNASDGLTGGSGHKVALHRNVTNTATISNAATSTGGGGSGAADSHAHSIAGGNANQDVMNPFVVVSFIIRH